MFYVDHPLLRSTQIPAGRKYWLRFGNRKKPALPALLKITATAVMVPSWEALHSHHPTSLHPLLCQMAELTFSARWISSLPLWPSALPNGHTAIRPLTQLQTKILIAVLPIQSGLMMP